jgi:hypothetical protein
VVVVADITVVILVTAVLIPVVVAVDKVPGEVLMVAQVAVA